MNKRLSLFLIILSVLLQGCTANPQWEQAVEDNNVVLVGSLIQEGHNFNDIFKNGDTPLIRAAQNGHTNIVRLLIENGADFNVENQFGDTAFILAAENGHIDTVRLLISKGVDYNYPNKYGITPMILAAKYGHAEIVRLLIDKGVDLNHKATSDNTALILAARYGHSETVRLIVENGAELNLSNLSGNTALILAAHYGHAEIVRLLIDKGVDLNFSNQSGNTALILAARYGHSETVRLIVENGAELNLSNRLWGNTALIVAAQEDNKYIIRLIIDKGADLNIQNKNGDTALHIVATNGRWNLLDLLLIEGANAHLFNAKGQDAASAAKTPTLANRIRTHPSYLAQQENQKRELAKIHVTGTGWIAEGGFIVTNAHVVENFTEIELTYIDKSTEPAQVVVIDFANDLAILKGAAKSRPPGIPISLRSPRIGAQVFTIGYPRPGVMGLNQKLTSGLISSLSGVRDDPRFMQMTVPIQSGNSGGPLINTSGEVVGITTAVLRSKIIGDEVNVSQNVNYAIKSIYLRALLETVNDKGVSRILPRKKASFEDLFDRIDQSVVLINVIAKNPI